MSGSGLARLGGERKSAKKFFQWSIARSLSRAPFPKIPANGLPCLFFLILLELHIVSPMIQTMKMEPSQVWLLVFAPE